VVSDDQLTWTSLRHTTWSDGAPHREGFRISPQRLLNPKTLGAVYASIQYPLKNAEAVNHVAADQLGVRRSTTHAEVKLEIPRPTCRASEALHRLPGSQARHRQATSGGRRAKPLATSDAFGEHRRQWTQGSPSGAPATSCVVTTTRSTMRNVCFTEVIFTQSDHVAMVRRAQAGEIDRTTPSRPDSSRNGRNCPVAAWRR
jgi:hypothetical protein